MERRFSLKQDWDTQIKMIPEVHTHENLEHKSDIGEEATGLRVIAQLWTQAHDTG